MTNARFLLNGNLVEVGDIHPTTTVLDFVRLEAQLTGTKEGCAEGDCGACTVMVSDLGDDGRTLTHRAVNSCLMTVGQADGRAITTVEGVGGPDGKLHPVQQAMVDGDGTQCGYCTPGFVMAMVAFEKGGEAPEEETIHDMLAGNLCRCTGYRPIVEACQNALEAPEDMQGVSDDDHIAAALEKLSPSVEMVGGEQHFFAPKETEGLAKLLAVYPDAWILSGGTDIGLRFSKGREKPPHVISLSRIKSMGQVSVEPDAIRLGAACLYSDILPALAEHYPNFADLVRRIGSRQIRNLGTVGGNLVTASPIGDTLPCLMALRAEVVLNSASGVRRMPLESFITGYRETALREGEFLEEISVPLLASGQQFYAYKISKRFDQDISAVVMASTVSLSDGVVQDISLAVGGVGPRTLRASKTEAFLKGKVWTDAALVAAQEILQTEISPMDDFRASAEYRREVTVNLLRRLFLETGEAGEECRLEML